MATKWGILACGKICHDFTTAIRSEDPKKVEHNIIACAATSYEKAKKFADHHDIPTAYGSYEELARDPQVDIVYIGAINSEHYPIAKMVINHGKSVLIEKPLTLCEETSRELVELSRQKKVFLMEGVWSRFFPVFKKLQEAKKTIGNILHVDVHFGCWMNKQDRLIYKELGGGTILDVGIYTINLIQMVLDDEQPLEIKAVGAINENGVDSNTCVSFKYKNGVTASMKTHLACKMPNEAIIVGSEGTIKISDPFHCPEVITVNDHEYVYKLPDTIEKCFYTNSSGLRYEANEVRRCLKAGLLECPFLTKENSLTIRKISDEILRQVGVNYKEKTVHSKL